MEEVMSVLVFRSSAGELRRTCARGVHIRKSALDRLQTIRELFSRSEDALSSILTTKESALRAFIAISTVTLASRCSASVAKSIFWSVREFIGLKCNTQTYVTN